MKVHIDLDECWTFFPVPEEEGFPYTKPTMEIPDSLFEEYKRVRIQWAEMNHKMEKLYRIQRGLKPAPAEPIPEHTVLKELS